MNDDFRLQLKEIAEVVADFPAEARAAATTELIKSLCGEWGKGRHGYRGMFDVRNPPSAKAAAEKPAAETAPTETDMNEPAG